MNHSSCFVMDMTIYKYRILSRFEMDVIGAVCKSFVQFPSSVFWWMSMLPPIAYVSSLIQDLTTRMSRGPIFIPIISDLLDGVSRTWITAIHTIIIIIFCRIHFLVIRKSTFIRRSAAPAAKDIISRSMKGLFIAGIINILSHITFLAVLQSKNWYVHHISLVIYYISYLVYQMLSGRITMIKNGDLWPPGFAVDIGAIILIVSGLPIYYSCVHYHIYGAMRNMGCVVYLFTAFVIYIKFIILAVSILGSRFIRIPSSST